MENNRKLALALLFLAILLLSSGCFNMTPRIGVPQEVRISIDSTKNCTEANCTCVLETRRDRYKWWTCEQGFQKIGNTVVEIPGGFYNSTQGEFCEDIRINGLPNTICFRYDRTYSPSVWRKKADCPWPKGDKWYTSCISGASDCGAPCGGFLWMSCGNLNGEYQLSCPLSHPNCQCAGPNRPPCWEVGTPGLCSPMLNAQPGIMSYFGAYCPCASLCLDNRSANFRCHSNNTNIDTMFMKCDVHYETSFQGGLFQVIQPCDANQMQSIVQDPLRDIPFFMIGQGATFEGFFNARGACKPYHEYSSTVRLGDSVFHPSGLNITNGSIICWESEDISHDLSLDGGANGTYPLTGKLCLDNLTLTTLTAPSSQVHTMRDLITDELSYVEVSTEGHLYVTEKGFNPQYVIYPDGRSLQVHNTDTVSHDLQVWDNQWGDGAPSSTLTLLAGTTQPFTFADVGPHLFNDSTANSTGVAFTLSNDTMITVDSGGISPTEVSLKVGGQICFTCASAIGHVLSIYEMFNTTELVFIENKTLGSQKICCWRPPPGTFYIRDTTTGADLTAYVTDKATRYKVELHNYNFDPPVLTVRNGTEVCFENPSPFARTINRYVPPAPPLAYTIAADDTLCGYYPHLNMQKFNDPFTKANLTIISYAAETVSVNISTLGAAPQFVQISPGGQVCFTNLDNIPHNVSSIPAEACMPSSGTAPVGNRMIDPNDISCYTIASQGAFLFTETSERPDPVNASIIIRTETNVTVISSDPFNYTYYILKQPPVNGSIQPPSLFMLSNDTLRWVNCHDNVRTINTSSPISNDVLQMTVPAMVAPPTGGVRVWDPPNDFLVGSYELADITHQDEYNLSARIFIADKDSYSDKISFIYTGPATNNNESTHLAVKWLPGDIGGYTLWMTREILGNRTMAAFPVNLVYRILVGLHPVELYSGADIRVPSGSNVTWVNVDNKTHEVSRSWVPGWIILQPYPDGNVTYTNIPAGPFTITERYTLLNYTVTAYDSDYTFNLSMSGYSSNPLNMDLGQSVCFVNYATVPKNLTITPPAAGYTAFNPNTYYSFAAGEYNIYVENSSSGTIVSAQHRLHVLDPTAYDNGYSLLLVNCTAGSYTFEYHQNYLLGSSSPLNIYYLAENGTLPGQECHPRNISIDGVNNTMVADDHLTPPMPNGPHNFILYYDGNDNTTTQDIWIYFGNSIDLLNPMPYSDAVLKQTDTIQWTNPAAFNGDRIAIQQYYGIEEINLEPNFGTMCYTPPINGTYLVQDISLPPLGNANIIVSNNTGTDVVFMNLLMLSTDAYLAETTPHSSVCWRSTDGNSYSLQTMEGPRTVPAGGQYCWNGPPPGTYVINETLTGASWLVVSSANEYKIYMFYENNIFDPPTAIVRPGTQTCFRNADTDPHTITMCRWLYNETWGGICKQYCNYSFPNTMYGPWTHKINTSGIGAGTWETHSETFWLDEPLPHTAMLRIQYDDCGSLTINGVHVPAMDDNTCPEDADNANCGCCRAGGCSGPCVPCGDWTQADVRDYLQNGSNTITVSAYDSYGAEKGYIIQYLDARRNQYTTWQQLIPPEETRCMSDPTTLPYPPASVLCNDPRPMFNFSDSETDDIFELNRTSATSCDTGIVSKIARKLNRYDSDIYRSNEFDIFMQYNPHGPGWPSIITSEVGQRNVPCVCAQLINISNECPNCTTALAVEFRGQAADLQFVNNVLGTCGSSVDVVGLFIDGNALDNTDPACDPPNCTYCNFTKYWKKVQDFTKRVLYIQPNGKPSVILSFKMSEDPVMCWNDETIGRLYKEFYSNPITQLTGAGIFGISQACYDEGTPPNYLDGDCFINVPPAGVGIVASGAPLQPQYDNWFHKCGNYYFNSEGLTMCTFSYVDTNSTACDSSRIMDIYQQYKCYAE